MSLLKSTDLAVPSVAAFRFESAAHAQAPLPAEHEPRARAMTHKVDDQSPRRSIDSRVVEADHLLTRIAELEKAAALAAEEHEKALALALDQGRDEGTALAEVRADEAIELLRSGVENGRADFNANLERQMEIGTALAQAIVQQVLGDTAVIGDRVIATARRWIDELSAAKIVRLKVAAQDFARGEDLAELETLLAQGVVERDPSLDAGACIFELSLGKLDASLPLQLQRALDHLGAAHEGATS